MRVNGVQGRGQAQRRLGGGCCAAVGAQALVPGILAAAAIEAETRGRCYLGVTAMISIKGKARGRVQRVKLVSKVNDQG